MDKFQILKNCGDGTYGVVYQAMNKTTREVVAIKKMKKKFETWDEAMRLREVKSLRRLNHQNVVKLKEVLRVQNDVYLVFEYMSGTILDYMQEQQRYRGANGVPADKITSIMKQILTGLDFIHGRGYFHRDLKPENLLYQDNQLKLADFGLSKDFKGCTNHTNYVSTRWYRAPEIILRQKNYGSAIDVFAAGCIFAELYTGQPLIPGTSESDMLHRLSKLIGCVPTSWRYGFDTAANIGLTNLPGAMLEPNRDDVIRSLQSALPAATIEALDLISQMLSWNPKNRPSCAECLQHPFFKGIKANTTKHSKMSSLNANDQQIHEMHYYNDKTKQRITQNQLEEQKQMAAASTGR